MPADRGAAPRISVIVPCRDASAWIGETLESAFAQTGVTFEVLVVDDGSTDDSVAIAARAGARVLQRPPRGVSHARNDGTAEARGAYLQYLDADDVLEPGTLARRVEVLDRTGVDVALVAWRRWQRERTGAFVAGETIRRRLGFRPDVDLLVDGWWPPGAILYRRSIVERIGGWRTDLPIIQDARFLLDAALAGASFDYVDEPGLRYRVHGPSSLSRRDPAAFSVDCYRSAAELHDRWVREGTLDAPRRQALLRTIGHVARDLFAFDRARFDQAVERIASLDPHYRPEEPSSLRVLSGVIGYRSAEQVAFWWRQVKGMGRRP